MKLTEKDREFLYMLRQLMESRDLRVELKQHRPSYKILRGTYGEKISKTFRMIASCEGTDWIGRPVEYEHAFMRFLDSPGDEEELDAARSASPAQQP